MNNRVSSRLSGKCTYGQEFFQAVLNAALVNGEQGCCYLVYCFGQTMNVVAVSLKEERGHCIADGPHTQNHAYMLNITQYIAYIFIFYVILALEP